MLTLRPTRMLATQLRMALPAGDIPIKNFHADWCAHAFTAGRYRYILLANTHSYLSVVMAASGITSEDAFIRASLGAVREYLINSGRTFAFERNIEPAANSVRFARIPDRRVIGTMNELIFQATLHLAEDELSPYDTSDRLNEVPLSALWNRGDTVSPGVTFDRMPPN